MEQAQDTDHRLNDLEIKATYAEDLLDQLDKIIVRQQAQIDLLIREVSALKLPAVEPGMVSMRSVRDDLPPHF